MEGCAARHGGTPTASYLPAKRSLCPTFRWYHASPVREYVDVERSCFFLPDSKTGRKAVHVGPAVLELLARSPRLAGNPFVCAGARHGAPLVGIDKAWKRLTKQAGLEGVRLQDLRHSFASVGAAAGLGLPLLGTILGHSNSATTAMGFWNPSQDRESSRAACKGIYTPEKFTVRIDDSHDRWRYRIAATALWGQNVGLPSFFILCTEYVLQHHRKLKEMRRIIRLRETAMRREKRLR
jgi:hypothetical protein